MAELFFHFSYACVTATTKSTINLSVCKNRKLIARVQENCSGNKINAFLMPSSHSVLPSK